jgi:hypothetical protein
MKRTPAFKDWNVPGSRHEVENEEPPALQSATINIVGDPERRGEISAFS